jgi:hypothetical protein
MSVDEAKALGTYIDAANARALHSQAERRAQAIRQYDPAAK